MGVRLTMKRLRKELLLLLTIVALLTPGCDQIEQTIATAKPGAATPLSSLDAPEEVKNVILSHATRAARLNRNALLHFSLEGCGPCIRLDEEVLASREWRDFAKANLIESIFDFPSQITSEDTELIRHMQTMEALVEKLKLSGGFPTLVIVGRDGSILGGRSGLQPGGGSGYVSWAQGLLQADTSPKTAAPVPASASIPATPAKIPPDSKTFATATASTKAETSKTTAAPLAPAATAPVPPASPQEHLQLRGLAGPLDRRIALIHTGVNTHTFKLGQVQQVTTPAGELKVECLEIRDRSVLVKVGNGAEPHELCLP